MNMREMVNERQKEQKKKREEKKTKSTERRAKSKEEKRKEGTAKPTKVVLYLKTRCYALASSQSLKATNCPKSRT